MTRVVITYGTFDMFHVGHLNLLTRLRALGGRLVVGVSTDEFNSKKGKRTFVPYADRVSIISSLACVDEAFPEDCWEQKADDIVRFNAGLLGMGHDWQGKFDHLKNHCEVMYLPRTESISSSDLKRLLNVLDQNHVRDLKEALDLIATVVSKFE